MAWETITKAKMKKTPEGSGVHGPDLMVDQKRLVDS